MTGRDFAAAQSALAANSFTARGMILSDGIRAAAARTPSKVAVVESGRSLTYRQLIERNDRVSSLAAGLGVAFGDRVAIMAPNCIEYVELVCGLSANGHPVAKIGPAAGGPEISFILEHSDAKLLFVHHTLLDKVMAVDRAAVKQVIVIGGDYEDLLSRAKAIESTAPVNERDTFSIPYTSGSTGKPKGVMLSHRARIMNAFATAVEHGCYSPDDRALGTTPMFHGAGFLNVITPLFFGGFVEILPRFDIEQLLGSVERLRATVVNMIPTHFSAMLALEEKTGRRFDLSSVKCVFSGTAPLPQSMKGPIIERFGEGKLNERYGSTEAGVVTCLRPFDQLRKIQCVGLPMPLTHVKIIDKDGNEAVPNTVGELWSRSPYMFNGYWDAPETTAKSLRDGWFSAGDLARVDEEGYVYIVDRKNDMIISGGENIYPREVEEVLLTHPAVAECAVVGLPHEYWGEAVTAFVALKPGRHASDKDLVDHCAAVLTRFKLPKAVKFVDRLPRNSMGKILRRDLRTVK
jgi:long-chain acyl-CoA synthetase